MHYEKCNFQAALLILDELDIDTHDVERDFKTNNINYAERTFDYTRYINYDKETVKATFRYAESRRIHSGYLPGVYYTRRYLPDGGYTLDRHPALMFLHTDLNGNICGAKFRNIDSSDPRRFTARGTLGFYILDTGISESFKKNKIYICESETSSNSLWKYFMDISTPAIVLSMGGVASSPKELPNHFSSKEKYLIVDYDGNESLYQERIKKYEHLNCKPIKMILPKGEDINSLYVKDKMYLIEHLINNS